jgi:hypothetical protein
MTALLGLVVALALLTAMVLGREIRVRRALETLIGTLIHRKGKEHETKIYRADTSHPDDDPAADDGRVR